LRCPVSLELFAHFCCSQEKEFREIFNRTLCVVMSVRCCSSRFAALMHAVVDKDRSGSISKIELQQLLDTLAINASQQEIDLMIGEIDKNNDGTCFVVCREPSLVLRIT
jgi:hypothetical protein